MPRRKSPEDRAVRINVSLTPKTLEQIDANVDKLQKWLINEKGKDEKDVLKVVNRSAVITQVVSMLAEESGFYALRGGFAAALGVVDNGQQDLFGE